MNWVQTLASLFTWPSANAATVFIGLDRFGDRVLIISGEIKKGDFEKVENLSSEIILGKGGFIPQKIHVHVNTPGGDLVEAIKIGRFLRSILASADSYGRTIIGREHPSSKHFVQGVDESKRFGLVLKEADAEIEQTDLVQNLSAGVFIFYGAVDRAHRDNADERKGWPGQPIPVFGLHRPYYDRTYFSTLKPQEAAEAYDQLVADVSDYLDEMGAPAKLVELMLDVPSNNIRYFSDNDFRELYDDKAPFLEEWLISKCGSSGATSLLTLQEARDFASMQAWQSRQRALDNSASKYKTDLYDNPEYDADYSASIWSKVRTHNQNVEGCRSTAVYMHQFEWASAYVNK